MAKNKEVLEGEGSSSGINASTVSEWVKKTVMTGVGAVFMTEEGIKNALSEMKMPKNVISAVIAQAEKTKSEVASMIAKEVRQFLDRIEVDEIIQRALSGQTIEIKATIKLAGNKNAARRTKTKSKKPKSPAA